MRYDPEEDRRLLLRARNGDDDALDCLAERWRPYVLALCRRECPDPDAVEDAVQDTLIRLVSHVDRVNPDRPLGPWVQRIARNVCHDVGRGKARRPEPLRLGPGSDDGDFVEIDPGTDPNTGPEAQVLGSEVRAHLDHCLGNLRPEYRLLIDLHYLADIPRDELDRHWPATLKPWRIKQTLSHWLKAARHALRQCLEARGVDDEAVNLFLDRSAGGA